MIQNAAIVTMESE